MILTCCKIATETEDDYNLDQSRSGKLLNGVGNEFRTSAETMT